MFVCLFFNSLFNNYVNLMSDSIWHLPSSFSTDFMLCYYSTYSTYYHTVSINFSKDNPEQSYPRETWDVPRLAHLIFTLLIIPPSFLPLFYLHLSSNPLNPLIWPFSLLYPSIYPCKTFSFPFQPLNSLLSFKSSSPQQLETGEKKKKKTSLKTR